MISGNAFKSKMKIDFETVTDILIVLRRCYGNATLSEIENKAVKLLKELKIDGSGN